MPRDVSGDETSRGVYGISVAAELTGSTVQALRLYERRGLVTPERTAGGTRRYSARDVVVIRRVSALIADGLNLAGIARVLELESDNSDLQSGNDALLQRNGGLETDNARLRADNDALAVDNAALRTANAAMTRHRGAAKGQSQPH